MSIFKEHNGKFSSKRVWGAIILTSAILMTIAGGFHVYSPSESIVEIMFMSGCAVLGIGVFSKGSIPKESPMVENEIDMVSHPETDENDS